MSMRPEKIEAVPQMTVEVAKAAFPKGNVYLTMRDELGTIFDDGQFVDLFPQRGQPAIAPWQLALVTLMQFAENLTDRQAADQVRARIDWKYALGLGLRDAGFDYSVLSEFRSRLLAGEAEARLLDTLLSVGVDRGWLKAGRRQRTDSTHVLAAVRQLNRLEVVGETLHHVLNVIAQVDPIWLKKQVTQEWWTRYSQRFSEYRFPKGETKQLTLAETIGRDGNHLLCQIYAPDAPAYLRVLPGVEILRQVWIQQFYTDNDRLRWRDNKNIPPAALMIASPYDVEVRLSEKRGKAWRGYKVHLTETCEPDEPHLITNVATTSATLQDNTALPTIQQQLQQRDLLPDEHLLDGGYLSVDLLLNSRQFYDLELVGPLRPDGSWQARDKNAYDLSHFSIDWTE